jgi:benzoylformate decarboxylase
MRMDALGRREAERATGSGTVPMPRRTPEPGHGAPRPGRLCREIFFDFLEAQGVPFIFGNPGTTELPLVDGCSDHPSVRYVMAMHEDIAVAQAMGYARASGQVGVVNLHVAPGVAHGLGNLYNAFRARVPLLVTAGQVPTGLMLQDPILTADLAGLVQPFTKWAYEVRAPEELPMALQRAFKEVTTPPYGPVFVSMPMDLLLEEYEQPEPARVSRIGRTVPFNADLDRAAELLRGARNPMILSGDGVGHARAWSEIAGLAEMLGARVRTEGYSTLWNFPSSHPLFAGPMPNQPAAMRAVFDDVDVLLMCGVTSQAPISRFDDGGPLIPWRVRTVTLDDAVAEVGKNQPVEIGLIGDIGVGLAGLADRLRRRPPAADVVAERMSTTMSFCAERTAIWEKKVAEARAASRPSPAMVAAELRDLLPPQSVLVDETISNRASFVNVLEFDDPLSYFAANGLSLGYSPSAAAGIKLALPERTVVNVVGDGSLLYYPHALWSAASGRTPVLFVVLNNGEYRVLKQIIDRMGGPWGAGGDMPVGLDLTDPPVDFVTLARSMGVEGERVTAGSELRGALERGIAAGRPYLVEVVIEQTYRAEG